VAKFGDTPTTELLAGVKFGDVLTTDDMATVAPSGKRGIVGLWTGTATETTAGATWSMRLGVPLDAARRYLVAYRALARASTDWVAGFSDGTTTYKMGPSNRGDSSNFYHVSSSCLFVPSASGFYVLTFWTSTSVTQNADTAGRQFWIEDVAP
jgi:hypothetical protein